MEKHQLHRTPEVSGNDDEFMKELDDKTRSMHDLEQAHRQLQAEHQDLQTAFVSWRKNKFFFFEEGATTN